jgi:hypothetical protein
VSLALSIWQNRYEGDPDRLAVLLPGGGWYTAARPLLHQARAVLLRHGWTVQEIWWVPPAEWRLAPPPWGDAPKRIGWVNHQVVAALRDEPASQVLFVGKSLGSLAGPTAAERSIPAIWLTPVLTEPLVVEALARSTAPTLLIGGTADKLWDPRVARTLGHRFVEVPDADHGLETDHDPVNSAEILRDVTIEMDTFVRDLGRRDDPGAG